MHRPIHGRFFIGGCSRSGTTFLQRFLAGHSRVHTFPETGVFLRALGMRGRLLPWAWLGLTLGKERKSLARLLEQIRPQGEAAAEAPPLPPRRFLVRSSAADVTEFFDALARGAGKDAWLEKTPRHVLHASRILRLVPGSRFVHMVRSGPDVVASMVDRARKHPGRFRGQEDPSYGVRQWNRSIRATLAAASEPGHLVIRYRDLAMHPQETLRALCPHLGLEFEEGMLEEGEEGRPHFVLAEEGWKAPREGPIRPAPSKFREVFDEPTRERITRSLDTRVFREILHRLESVPGRVWASGIPTRGDLPLDGRKHTSESPPSNREPSSATPEPSATDGETPPPHGHAS